MNKYLSFLVSGAVCMSLLSSCDGIMSGIYDDPDGRGPCDGFGTDGTLYIDATSYTDWVYIDFSERSVVTLDVEADAPSEWDIAVHRYDVKTNAGRALETEVSDFELAHGLTIDEDCLVGDVWTTDKVVTDMSTMLDGYLSYTDSFYNPEISRWLDVDTSTMPPVYTTSGRIYILCLADGSRVGIKFKDFMNDKLVKGHITIEYVYPF